MLKGKSAVSKCWIVTWKREWNGKGMKLRLIHRSYKRHRFQLNMRKNFSGSETTKRGASQSGYLPFPR